MLCALCDGSSCVTVGMVGTVVSMWRKNVVGGWTRRSDLGAWDAAYDQFRLFKKIVGWGQGGRPGRGKVAYIDGYVLLHFLSELPVLLGLLVDQACDMLAGRIFEVIAFAADDFSMLFSGWSDSRLGSRWG